MSQAWTTSDGVLPRSAPNRTKSRHCHMPRHYHLGQCCTPIKYNINIMSILWAVIMRHTINFAAEKSGCRLFTITKLQHRTTLWFFKIKNRYDVTKLRYFINTLRFLVLPWIYVAPLAVKWSNTFIQHTWNSATSYKLSLALRNFWHYLGHSSIPDCNVMSRLEQIVYYGWTHRSETKKANFQWCRHNTLRPHTLGWRCRQYVWHELQCMTIITANVILQYTTASH